MALALGNILLGEVHSRGLHEAKAMAMGWAPSEFMLRHSCAYSSEMSFQQRLEGPDLEG
jgi:hypothetical protein